MSERIEWDEDAAHHIRTRSERYPDAVDIEPDRIVDEPDPHSAHANSVRVVGYSPSASLVVTVVALRDQHGVLHGATAWRSNSKQRRQYQEGAVDD
ncbi:MAG TPA: hypothetical protein VIQ30_01290 [Pseudonocardia sp.]